MSLWPTRRCNGDFGWLNVVFRYTVYCYARLKLCNEVRDILIG
jgi:hypothetical protein